MAEETTEEPTAEDEAPQGVGGYLYRLALAGVGAVMLAQEELEARFKRRVETPSQEGEPLPRGASASSGASAPAGASASDEAPVGPSGEDDGSLDEDGEPKRGAFFSQIDFTVASFIHKLVPGRAEMDALAQQIDALAAEVEALKQD